MKKLLLKSFSVISLMLATSTVFATPTYTASVMPTSEALTSHLAAKANLQGARSVATDILVINYTNTDIVLAAPGMPRLITQRTSARIMSPDYAGFTTVVLQTPDGREIWRSYSVGPLDTLSVYVSYGQYVVYDTAN